RRRKRLARAAIVLLILMALTGGAWASWVYAIPHYTVVPRGLVGHSPAYVQARLRAADVRWQTGTAQPSAAVADGLLLRISPNEGKRVRRGSLIHLVFSSGPSILTVPTVIGKQRDEAAHILSEAKFVTFVRRQYSDSAPIDRVIGQDPPAGTRLQEGSPV